MKLVDTYSRMKTKRCHSVYTLVKCLYVLPILRCMWARMPGNLAPLTPHMASLEATLFRRRKSNITSPTTPAPLSESAAVPPTYLHVKAAQTGVKRM